MPVMLLHGVTDSWRSFEQVLPHLPASIRAIAITQRGHGDASRPDRYHYGDMAGDVAAFMDALGIPSAVLVGHSMGGLVAQRFAIDYPARVRGLVLMELSYPRGHARGARICGTPGSRRWPIRSTRPSCGRSRRARWPRRLRPAQMDTFVAESLKVPARVWQATFRAFLDVDFCAELGRHRRADPGGVGRPGYLQPAAGARRAPRRASAGPRRRLPGAGPRHALGTAGGDRRRHRALRRGLAGGAGATEDDRQ